MAASWLTIAIFAGGDLVVEVYGEWTGTADPLALSASQVRGVNNSPTRTYTVTASIYNGKGGVDTFTGSIPPATTTPAHNIPQSFQNDLAKIRVEVS